MIRRRTASSNRTDEKSADPKSAASASTSSACAATATSDDAALAEMKAPAAASDLSPYSELATRLDQEQRPVASLEELPGQIEQPSISHEIGIAESGAESIQLVPFNMDSTASVQDEELIAAATRVLQVLVRLQFTEDALTRCAKRRASLTRFRSQRKAARGSHRENGDSRRQRCNSLLSSFD